VDGLAKRRYDGLVRRVETLVRVSLKPERQGYGRQFVLSAEDIKKLGGCSCG
jgi:hypothetical protein